jgi:hypothetical protein
MKHQAMIRLIHSSQQQQQSNAQEVNADQDGKKEGKRVVAKKGREPPKIDVEG